MNFENLSPLAWCGIGFILFMVFSINIWLFSLLRNRRAESEESTWKKTAEALRDPFAKENKMLSDLARQVEKFKNNDEGERD